MARSGGKAARAIGLVLMVLGLACGLFAFAVIKGWVFGTMDIHGNRSMTWPASLLALMISGGAMIVLLLAGLMTWIIGASRDARRSQHPDEQKMIPTSQR